MATNFELIPFSSSSSQPFNTTTEEPNNNNNDNNASSTPSAKKSRRGRPVGSKNRPKQPIIVSQEVNTDTCLRPLILDLSSGCDITQTISTFSRNRSTGISILSGAGAVADVSLRHTTAVITLHGRFEILSISGTFLPPGEESLNLSASIGGSVSVTLAGGHGQVIGGIVAGGLTAAGNVVLFAAEFRRSELYRLPEPVLDQEQDHQEDAKPYAANPAATTAAEGIHHQHHHY